METTISEDGTFEVDDVEVRTPDGEYLVNSLDLRLDPGDTLLISGPSGIGKTVLLQSLAGLWPFVSGRVRLPAERQETMFVPQLPYVPLGDLRSVVSYPHEEGAVGDREIQQALIKVALSHLVIRINDVKDWAHILSVGEQQRIAFARILLSKPRAVFLDESTSAMDEGLELMLYELIRAELPKTILVSVSHRATVEQFHGRHLELVGDGEWRLDRTPHQELSRPEQLAAGLSRYLAGMEHGMFTPTLDWGNELLTSLVWIAKAWVIAAVCTLVILVLIARFTTWGRQFWRITGDYFNGPDSVKVWLWLALLLLIGDRWRSTRRALQLPGQRHDDQLPSGCSGPRLRQRSAERLWQRRLLAIDPRLLRHGRLSTSRGSCWICS